MDKLTIDPKFNPRAHADKLARLNRRRKRASAVRRAFERLRMTDRHGEWEPYPAFALDVSNTSAVTLLDGPDGWRLVPVRMVGGEHEHQTPPERHGEIVDAMLAAETWALVNWDAIGTWRFTSALRRRHRVNGVTWTTAIVPAANDMWDGHVIVTPKLTLDAALAVHQHFALPSICGLRAACEAADAWRPPAFVACPCPVSTTDTERPPTPLTSLNWLESDQIPPQMSFVATSPRHHWQREVRGLWQLILDDGRENFTVYTDRWPDVPCRSWDSALQAADHAAETHGAFDPAGTLEDPLTHGGPPRQFKFCRCGRCGRVAMSTPDDDFFGTSGQRLIAKCCGGSLFCQSSEPIDPVIAARWPYDDTEYDGEAIEVPFGLDADFEEA